MREKRCEKYCEMELISPTHVVRQASVKMAASRYAPVPSFCSSVSGSYTPEEHMPM